METFKKAVVCRKWTYNNNFTIFTHIQMQKRALDFKFCQPAFEN